MSERDAAFLPAAALEASRREGSVALATTGEILRTRLDGAEVHARDLLPELAKLLERAGVAVRELRTLVVGTGPGSFTGLRVAIATVQGLARATGAGVVAVPSLEAVAFAALSPGQQAVVLSDAHGGSYYRAVYERDVSALIERGAPALCPLSDLEGEVSSAPRLLAVEGDSLVERMPAELRERVELVAGPAADVLLELGRLRHALHGTLPPQEVEPLYLRPFRALPRKR